MKLLIKLCLASWLYFDYIHPCIYVVKAWSSLLELCLFYSVWKLYVYFSNYCPLLKRHCRLFRTVIFIEVLGCGGKRLFTWMHRGTAPLCVCSVLCRHLPSAFRLYSQTAGDYESSLLQNQEQLSTLFVFLGVHKCVCVLFMGDVLEGVAKSKVRVTGCVSSHHSLPNHEASTRHITSQPINQLQCVKKLRCNSQVSTADGSCCTHF